MSIWAAFSDEIALMDKEVNNVKDFADLFLKIRQATAGQELDNAFIITTDGYAVRITNVEFFYWKDEESE